MHWPHAFEMEEGWEAVLTAIKRSEYLVAKREYENLLAMLKQEGDNGEEFRVRNIVPHQRTINNMFSKCKLIDEAYMGMCSVICALNGRYNIITALEWDYESWTIGSTAQGITTRYHVDDDGCINLRVEGELEDLPLYEQLVVIWEVALYRTWLPYCSQSRVIKKIGKYLSPIKKNKFSNLMARFFRIHHNVNPQSPLRDHTRYCCSCIWCKLSP